MAPLALRVHLNHFNAIIIMRLSNIIFKGFCKEGTELHFLRVAIFGGGGRAGEWLRKGTMRRKRATESHPFCTATPPGSACTVFTCPSVGCDRGGERRRVKSRREDEKRVSLRPLSHDLVALKVPVRTNGAQAFNRTPTSQSGLTTS